MCNMSVEKGGQGGIVVNAVFSRNQKELQECPFFVGAQHFLVAFAKSLSINTYDQTSVRIITLCAVADMFQNDT